MSVSQLYQDMIKEHNKNPRNFKKMDDATHVMRGRNPLCGDDFWIFVKVVDEIIESVSFTGDGCAISKSSASMMTQHMKGLTLDEAQHLANQFLTMVLEEDPKILMNEKDFKRLKIFETVKRYPIRVKCATLSWRAFEEALQAKDDEKSEVSTE